MSKIEVYRYKHLYVYYKTLKDGTHLESFGHKNLMDLKKWNETDLSSILMVKGTYEYIGVIKPTDDVYRDYPELFI